MMTSGGGGITGRGSRAGGRQKRARTGCLGCRVRRRKCDEGKPRCQRCIDRGAECQYGARFVFLDKNALTIGSRSFELAPLSSSPSSPRHTNSSRPSRRAPSVHQERSGSSIGPGRHHTHSEPGSSKSPFPQLEDSTDEPSEPPLPHVFPGNGHPTEEAIFGNTADYGEVFTEGLLSPSRSRQADSRSNSGEDSQPSALAENGNVIVGGHKGCHEEPVMSPNTTRHQDDGFEIALNALLSLGGGNEGSNNVGPEPTPVTAVSDILQQEEQQISPLLELPERYKLQLLRHYRYKVAPWLDICDLGQTFGLSVPRLALTSDSSSPGSGSDRLLCCVLALSAVSLGREESRGLASTIVSSERVQHNVSSVYSTENKEFLCESLIATRKFLLSSPSAWKCRPWATLPWCEPGPDSQEDAAALWLCLRLELSAALLTCSPIPLPIYQHMNRYREDHRWFTTLPNRARGSLFHFGHESLLLCVKALDLITGNESPEDSRGGDSDRPYPFVERWKAMERELEAWFNSRPQEMQPMVELPGDDDNNDGTLEELRRPFPILVFTNGAAVFSNQLYHTAMLLLLHAKPRTLRLRKSKEQSISLSPLFHAQRVCGIALGNTGCRERWDPCLVASLYVAARRMTYEKQQQAVLQGIERIAEVTGWDNMCQYFSGALREEWGFFTGPSPR